MIQFQWSNYISIKKEKKVFFESLLIDLIKIEKNKKHKRNHFDWEWWWKILTEKHVVCHFWLMCECLIYSIQCLKRLSLHWSDFWIWSSSGIGIEDFCPILINGVWVFAVVFHYKYFSIQKKKRSRRIKKQFSDGRIVFKSKRCGKQIKSKSNHTINTLFEKKVTKSTSCRQQKKNILLFCIFFQNKQFQIIIFHSKWLTSNLITIISEKWFAQKQQSCISKLVSLIFFYLLKFNFWKAERRLTFSVSFFKRRIGNLDHQNRTTFKPVNSERIFSDTKNIV